MDTMADPRLDIGGNNPPERTALDAAAELTTTVNEWAASRPEFVDNDEATAAQGFVEKLRTSKKDLTAAQKVELVPHEEAATAVRTRYRDPLSLVEAALKTLLDKSGAWLAKERARIAAEKEAQAAEARRQREEADRLARESLQVSQQVTDDATEAKVAVDRATDAARDAKAAEQVAAKKPEQAAIKGAGSTRAMTLRTYWRAEVTDEAAALKSYENHPTVRKAALAAALQVANEQAKTSKSEEAAPLGFRFIKEERAV